MKRIEKKPMRKVERPMRKVVRKTASKKSLMKSQVKKIASAFEAEAELILADTEEAVKSYFPKKNVRASLAKVANALSKNGVKCRFDSFMKRTASDDAVVVTVEELQEAVDAIVNATIDEFEALLEETDEAVDTVIDDVVDELGEDEDIDIAELEDEVKSDLEEELACMGVSAGLARTKKRAAKRPLAARKAMPERKASARKAMPERKTVKRANPILSKMR